MAASEPPAEILSKRSASKDLSSITLVVGIPRSARNVRHWCERGDSNPHGFTRQILSLVRLPIPPLSQSYFSAVYTTSLRAQCNNAQRRERGQASLQG